MPKLTGLAPVLLVPDVLASLEWYRDVLGCETVPWEEEPSDYGYATRDGCTIHLGCGERAHPNAELRPPDMCDVYLWVDDVETLHAELIERGADVVLPPTDQPWRLREIRVRDPNGYILGIGERLQR